jgi:predicted DNA-binding transcriptional regulator AlpA
MQATVNVGLIHALPFHNRLVVSRREAASMTGCSVGYFDKLIRLGVMPRPLPLPGVRRWDKREILLALDALTGKSESRFVDEADLDKELAAFGAKHGYS